MSGKAAGGPVCAKRCTVQREHLSRQRDCGRRGPSRRDGGLRAGDFGLRSLGCGKRLESCRQGGANSDFCFRNTPFASLPRTSYKGARADVERPAGRLWQ